MKNIAILIMVALMLVALSAVCAVGCIQGGDAPAAPAPVPAGIGATGDILYEGSTASQEVVEDWAGGLSSGTQTGITVTYVDAAGVNTYTVPLFNCGTTAFTSSGTSVTVTHSVGTTPSACTANVNSGTEAIMTGTYTSTTFAVHRTSSGALPAAIISWCCGE